MADLGQRFLGALVDTVISAIAALPFAAVAVVLYGGTDPDEMMLVAEGGAFIGIFLLSIAQWYLIATRGQSLGKIAVGTRIVRMDGSPVDFVTGVVLRTWVVAMISGCANVLCLGWIVQIVDVLMIFGEERRCGHDLVAGTKVIVAVDGE